MIKFFINKEAFYYGKGKILSIVLRTFNFVLPITYGIESLPLNGSKNNFSYRRNSNYTFKKVTLSNTSWETAGLPTIAVLGTTGAFILGGPALATVVGYFGASAVSAV